MNFLKKTKGISKTEEQCGCCSVTENCCGETTACCDESMDCCTENEKSYSSTESKGNCSCSCSPVNDGKCC